jgi:hypothetical protein
MPKSDAHSSIDEAGDRSSRLGLTLINQVTAEWRVEEEDRSGLVTVWATIPL